MQSRATTVSDYLAAAPAERRAALAGLRAAIRRAAPDAVEAMLHGMPTYALAGEMLAGFASQKQYVALYFCDVPALERHRARLGTDDCGKSCIRYRDAAAIPLGAVEAMVRDGAAAWAARAAGGGPARSASGSAAKQSTEEKAGARKAVARKAVAKPASTRG